ncbi:MAG: hypothetical protein J2P45_07615 [Candidatus Dormibacteraeota bacterium]|nr:hypothetical protein [Candidatus Dormibacteraeota bacterium]
MSSYLYTMNHESAAGSNPPGPSPALPGGVIDVRRLAIVDIAAHGSTLILAEFVGAFILLTVLGALSLAAGLGHRAGPVAWMVAVGGAFVGMGLNYLPLLVHGVPAARGRSAPALAAPELAEPGRYAWTYLWQSAVFLLLPLAMLTLALVQLSRRTRVPAT